MPNPRNLAEVWASLVNRQGQTTTGSLEFMTSRHTGLDVNIRDQSRQVQANYERGSDGRDAERSMRGETPCAGPRDLTETGGSYGGLPPGTGGRKGVIPI